MGRRGGLVVGGVLVGSGWLWLLLSNPVPAPRSVRHRNEGQLACPQEHARQIPPVAPAAQELATTAQTSAQPIKLNIVEDDSAKPKLRQSGHAAGKKSDSRDSRPPESPITLDSLLELPHVHSITVASIAKPEQRIVHILNMHHVSQENYLASRGTESLAGQTSDDHIREYETILDEIDMVQDELHELLLAVIRKHHLRGIYSEAVFPESRPMLKHLKRNRIAASVARKRPSVADLFCTQFGALGRLFLSGKLEEIFAAEDRKLYLASYPALRDGTLQFDWEAQERREDAIIERMTQHDGTALIVLGGGHDLTDNIQRLGKRCEYIRVMANRYWEFVEKL